MRYGGVHSPQLLTAHKLQPVGFGTHEHCCYIANGSALEKVGYPAGAYARAVRCKPKERHHRDKPTTKFKISTKLKW
jgi:hypothetical protein